MLHVIFIVNFVADIFKLMEVLAPGLNGRHAVSFVEEELKSDQENVIDQSLLWEVPCVPTLASMKLKAAMSKLALVLLC